MPAQKLWGKERIKVQRQDACVTFPVQESDSMDAASRGDSLGVQSVEGPVGRSESISPPTAAATPPPISPRPPPPHHLPAAGDAPLASPSQDASQPMSGPGPPIGPDHDLLERSSKKVRSAERNVPPVSCGVGARGPYADQAQAAEDLLSSQHWGFAAQHLTLVLVPELACYLWFMSKPCVLEAFAAILEGLVGDVCLGSSGELVSFTALTTVKVALAPSAVAEQ